MMTKANVFEIMISFTSVIDIINLWMRNAVIVTRGNLIKYMLYVHCNVNKEFDSEQMTYETILKVYVLME